LKNDNKPIIIDLKRKTIIKSLVILLKYRSFNNLKEKRYWMPQSFPSMLLSKLAISTHRRERNEIESISSQLSFASLFYVFSMTSSFLSAPSALRMMFNDRQHFNRERNDGCYSGTSCG
jgi:hypothetical protein